MKGDEKINDGIPLGGYARTPLEPRPLCNCGTRPAKVPCNELILAPHLNTSICENCFNLLKEKERKTRKNEEPDSQNT